MSAWGLQFSVGDQTLESRKAFSKTGFKKCVKCNGTKIKSEKHVAGCRMNGDAYGTYTFECEDCKWLTSFHYDDSGDNYFYEISEWKDKTSRS